MLELGGIHMRELNDYTANLSEKSRIELEKKKMEYKKVAMCIGTMNAMDVTTHKKKNNK